jgi:alkylation response protein AidB-like acyl-CoA dehydrogenase
LLKIGHDARQYTTHSQLPEEHQMIHEMCRKFADEELAPNAGKWDQDHAFPKEAVSQLVRKRVLWILKCLHKGQMI